MIERTRKQLVAVLVWLIAPTAACSMGKPGFIEGSAKLPACSEAPVADLSGTWFDTGTVSITSAGCEGVDVGEMLASCPLNWTFEQTGNEVKIGVDEEYEIHGRFCGSTLHLEGGWWLAVVNDAGMCNYDDDDGTEVGIESEGSELTFEEDPMTGTLLRGTLVVRGQCSAQYEMQLTKL